MSDLICCVRWATGRPAPIASLRATARLRNRRTTMVTARGRGRRRHRGHPPVFLVATRCATLAAARRTRPPPEESPASPRTSTIRSATASSNSKRDLAVGRASVAIANDTAAFVITADDGVYHRLDLPDFDPALYAAGGSEVSGLALSPDAPS